MNEHGTGSEGTIRDNSDKPHKGHFTTERMRDTDRQPTVGRVIRTKPQSHHTHWCDCLEHMFLFAYHANQSTSYNATCPECRRVYRFSYTCSTGNGKHDEACIEKVGQE